MASLVESRNYEERVYAGVLGKIIGVYLGRPFEGWTNKRIEAELGEIWYYVHEKCGVPLVVADDDISGTFTFLRALSDHGASHVLTAEQIGHTWLNYLIEKRTVLWWGGVGMSTEHTAYARLKAGIPAPRSGSRELNGRVVSEQIGAQIFIDGWAMVCPGDPEKAVALAGKAASVSHDGEAVYGAQVVAAIESLAFVESGLPEIIDTAAGLIPAGSLIRRLIDDLRSWHADAPDDWRATFRKVEERYGYDTYGGNCHMVPNHAVIILALLYGQGDFRRSLMVANTAGWDTDCNSANVGCILGIKNGLAGIDAGPDWRGPVADRLYLPTADGARCVTDAVRETYEIVNLARALQGLAPAAPKEGSRFHFSLPGSVQGFLPDLPSDDPAGSVALCRVEHSERDGVGTLGMSYQDVADGETARAGTATFVPTQAFKQGGYTMAASPSIYAGQVVRARVAADAANTRPAEVCLYVQAPGEGDSLKLLRGPAVSVPPGQEAALDWEVPGTDGSPLVAVGVEVGGTSGSGRLHLDRLTWDGTPRVTLGRPEGAGGDAWRRAWVNAADHFETTGVWDGNIYKVIQNDGTGLVFQGDQGWGNYTVSTDLYPHLADEIGLLANVRGMRRYVALTLRPDGIVRLIARQDDVEDLLAAVPLSWTLDHKHPASLTSRRDGTLTAAVQDGDREVVLAGRVPAECARGAVGLQVTVGHAQFGPVLIEPVP